MQVTANGNFEKSKSWNGIKKHLEHDPNIVHSNKYLNTEESKKLRKYNEKIDLIDYDDWTEKHFKDYVRNHDLKNVKKSRFVWGSVANFLKTDAQGNKRKKTFDKLYVEKFSNEETYKKLLELLQEDFQSEKDMTVEQANDASYKLIRDSIRTYVKGFNERNKHLYLFASYTHLDELGAPHMHGRVMPFVPADSRGKKPSWSLNKALRLQFGDKNGKNNLKAFRKQEDQAMIDAVNEQIKEKLPELAQSFHLDLTRKHDSQGLTHDEYVAKTQLEDSQKQVDERQKQLDKREKSLDNYQKFQEKTQIDLSEFQSSLDKRENELNQRENDLNRRETTFNKTMTKAVEKFNKTVDESNKKFHEKNDILNKKNDELNRQILTVKKLKDDLTNRINRFESKIKKFFKNYKHIMFNVKKNFEKTDDNKIISDSEKLVKKNKRDLNNDGIDDSQENLLQSINIEEVDPLLDLNNKENEEQQDENQKN